MNFVKYSPAPPTCLPRPLRFSQTELHFRNPSYTCLHLYLYPPAWLRWVFFLVFLPACQGWVPHITLLSSPSSRHSLNILPAEHSLGGYLPGSHELCQRGPKSCLSFNPLGSRGLEAGREAEGQGQDYHFRQSPWASRQMHYPIWTYLGCGCFFF